MTGPDYGGARESHAGDEFHVLWAVRRALTMLLPNAPLRRLVVEGVSPKDQLDDVEDHLQGVDLTEYFDGAKFEQSSQVVIAQLKYSERKPARRWTVARLAQKPTRGKPVVARLAEAFKAFAKAYPREEVASKLRVRLISNQPLDPTLGTLLETSKARLGDQPSAARLDAVVDGLGSRQTEALERLRAASGLGKRDFADFLLALDLNGLGSGTRWRLEGEITEALSSHLIDEPGPSFAQLMQMVRILQRTPTSERNWQSANCARLVESAASFFVTRSPKKDRGLPDLAPPEKAEVAQALALWWRWRLRQKSSSGARMALK